MLRFKMEIYKKHLYYLRNSIAQIKYNCRYSSKITM